jgi:hypothetical protein
MVTVAAAGGEVWVGAGVWVAGGSGVGVAVSVTVAVGVFVGVGVVVGVAVVGDAGMLVGVAVAVDGSPVIVAVGGAAVAVGVPAGPGVSGVCVALGGAAVAVGVLDGVGGTTVVAVAVAGGVLVGAAGTTTIVPCMKLWTVQWYGNVPVVVKVTEALVVPPVIMPVSHTPLSLVLLCGVPVSVLAQITVVPAVTVSTAGTNCRLAMVTVATGVEADCTCAGAFAATATPPSAATPQAMQASPSASARLPHTHRRGCAG